MAWATLCLTSIGGDYGELDPLGILDGREEGDYGPDGAEDAADSVVSPILTEGEEDIATEGEAESNPDEEARGSHSVTSGSSGPATVAVRLLRLGSMPRWTSCT